MPFIFTVSLIEQKVVARRWNLDSPEDSEDILCAFDFEQLECHERAAHLTAEGPKRHGDFADRPCRAQPLEQCRVFTAALPVAPEPERVDLLREELGRSAEAEHFDEPRIRVDEGAGAPIEDADRDRARLEDLAVAELRFVRATLLLAPFGDILEQESDAVGWDREGRDGEQAGGIVPARSFPEVYGLARTHHCGELLGERRPGDGRKVLIDALPDVGGRDVGGGLRGRVQGDDPEGRRVGRIFEAQDSHADRSKLEELFGELCDFSKAVRTHRTATRDMIVSIPRAGWETGSRS